MGDSQGSGDHSKARVVLLVEVSESFPRPTHSRPKAVKSRVPARLGEAGGHGARGGARQPEAGAGPERGSIRPRPRRAPPCPATQAVGLR